MAIFSENESPVNANVLLNLEIRGHKAFMPWFFTYDVVFSSIMNFFLFLFAG